MKKLYSIMLAAALMLPLCFGCIGVKAEENTQSYRKGDVNGNGVIDVSDYITVRLCILGQITLSEEAKYAADIDENGVIGITDYIYLRLHLLGIVNISENETAQYVDAIYDGVTDRSKNAVNSMLGAEYTYNALPSDDYPDSDCKKLTDGEIPGNFNADSWAGLYKQNNTEIIFDLGTVTSGLADLRVASLRKLSYGIGLSSKMDLYISNDGVKYTYVSSAEAAADAEAEDMYYYELRLPLTVSARYVKLSFAKCETVWFFISEVEFISYGGVEPNYYGTFEAQEITTQAYWNSSDTDYNVSKNMLKNLSYQMKPLTAIAANHQTDYYNTPVSNTALTDGVRASSTSYTNTAYFHITQSGGRFILLDLGALSTVTSFSGEFLKQTATGISPPSRIAVYVSEDGVTYGKAGEGVFSTDAASQIFNASFTFNKKYKARYVVIYLQVYAHVWCSELEVYGTKKIQSDAVTADEVDYIEDVGKDDTGMGDKDGYLMPEDFLGVNNVMLSYHCLTDSSGGHSESGLITADEYLPYVGYYDKDGNLMDTFMDGFLYLPYTAFNYSDYAKTLAGWKFYIDNQFAANRNVAALNSAAAEVKSSLGCDDYTVSVFFSILYTFKALSNGQNTFGDVDGDGVNENFATLEGRKKAIKWIIDEQISKFESGNYSNLDLKGFYWFEESAGSDSQDTALIKYAADYLHSMDYVLFWIPWYKASGYDKWEEFGFDAACMQPNYAFSDSVDVSRLYDNAEYTKSLGMCVEFESNGTTYASIKKIK
ncbi:MAG: DUF4855 domain-containing protein, partial [Eubacteriales bacterium]|nr:DUF4855 domain-containing protein [Eubacteriales bacterium]